MCQEIDHIPFRPHPDVGDATTRRRQGGVGLLTARLDASISLFLYCGMSARLGRVWWAVFLCLAWSLVQALGCSSKEVRYPLDHARYRRIDAAVDSLKKAYVEKDLSGVRSLMLPSDPLDRLEREISKDFQHFQEISLDFSIERIVIEGDTIDVFVHWHGQWKRTSADPGLRERGHGKLRWVGVQSILLNSVDGDLPFGMASRRATPEPRRSGAP